MERTLQTDQNRRYPRRAKRSFVDDPKPWLLAVGGLRRGPTGIHSTAIETAEANLRLVLWKTGFHPHKSDAFQEGVIGMLRAFETYEPKKGGAFSTYASYWIRQNILRMQDEHFPFHLPEGVKQIVWGFRRRKNPIPFPMKDAEIADRYNTTEETVARARELARARYLPVHDLVPVNERVPTDASLTRDEWVERHDALTDGAATPEDVAVTADRLDAVRRSLAMLTPREREVIRWRFGFDGDEESLEDVGRRLDVTRERVRQIEIKAIRKLRYAREIHDDSYGTVGEPIAWSHSQYECAKLVRALAKGAFLGEDSYVPNELVEAVVAYFFRASVRGTLREMERSAILARSPDRCGWKSVRGIQELGLPGGTSARFAPQEAAERLLAHWSQGVRAFDDRHFWQDPGDLSAERRAAELEMRITAIRRRERLIAALLPCLQSDVLRDRRDALAREAERLRADHDAILCAIAEQHS